MPAPTTKKKRAEHAALVLHKSYTRPILDAMYEVEKAHRAGDLPAPTEQDVERLRAVLCHLAESASILRNVLNAVAP